MGVGCGHDLGGVVAATRRAQQVVTAVVVAVVAAAVVGFVVLRLTGSSGGAVVAAGPTVVKASVTDVVQFSCPDMGVGRCVTIDARLADGVSVSFDEALAPSFSTPAIGDRIVVGVVRSGGSSSYYFADFDRDLPLGALAGVFIVSVIALGRLRGVGALVGLGLSIAMVVGFLVPAIADGASPLAAALVTAVIVASGVMFLAHGATASTAVALVGTLASLMLTGVLAGVFIPFAHITGLVSEEAAYLATTGGQVDVRGLLLAGIIVGSLGVLDDVTVTQVSAVVELRRQRPEASFRAIAKPALRIGRAHVSSTVNTLVLAYVGASLPLLLVVADTAHPATDVINGELIASEIVRALAGSIGLVTAVPITTALAAWLLRISPSPGSNPEPPAQDTTTSTRRVNDRSPTDGSTQGGAGVVRPVDDRPTMSILRTA
jgi:uncharacterized membrane protein